MMAEKVVFTHIYTSEHGQHSAGCWLSASGTWCDFKLFEVVSWTLDGEILSWQSDDDNDGVQNMLDASSTIDGHVKWDGCIEFTFGGHWCDAAESIAILHKKFQWMLAQAHAAMSAQYDSPPDWEPVKP